MGTEPKLYGPRSGHATVSASTPTWRAAALAACLTSACVAPVLETELRADATAGVDALAGPDVSTPADRADAGPHPGPDAGLGAHVRAARLDFDITGEDLFPDTLQTSTVTVYRGATRLWSSLGAPTGPLPVPTGERTVVVHRPGEAPVGVVGTSTLVAFVEKQIGRGLSADTAYATVELSIYGMRPWTQSSRLRGFSAAGISAPIDWAFFFAEVPPGETAVERVRARWWPYERRPRGRPVDDFHVGRYDEVAGSDGVTRVLTEIATFEDLEVVVGSTLARSATMTPAMADLDVDLEFIDRLDPSIIHPRAQLSSRTAAVEMSIVSASACDAAPVRALASTSLARAEGRLRASVPRPPEGWWARASFVVMHVVEFPTRPMFFATSGTTRPLADVVGGRVEIDLSPPRAITVNGMSTATPVTGATRTPMIAWQAPERGRAAGYAVTVHARERRPDGLGWVEAGVLYTRGTSVVIPEGWLAPPRGEYYFVVVEAVSDFDKDHWPPRPACTRSWSVALTDVVFP